MQRAMSKNTRACLVQEVTPRSNGSPTANKNCKILIAEDISFNRVMITEMLDTLGYTNIHSEENGQKAYHEMEKAFNMDDPYQVLLLDLRMPVMDGYDVINAVKKRGWPLPTIVVVTASVMEEDRQKCTKLGVKYFITKPIELIELKKVLSRVTVNREL
jgi:CheY-like chemotaxis protein